MREVAFPPPAAPAGRQRPGWGRQGPTPQPPPGKPVLGRGPPGGPCGPPPWMSAMPSREGGGHGRGCVFKALMKNVSPQLSSKDAHSLCHVLHLQTLQGRPKQAHSVSVQNRPYSCTIISCPRVISHTNHWEPAFAPQRPQYFPGAPRPASG